MNDIPITYQNNDLKEQKRMKNRKKVCLCNNMEKQLEKCYDLLEATILTYRQIVSCENDLDPI